MKKADLKQLIRPLVKECIHEVLIEEGMLSNIVSEVAQGMRTSTIVEAAPAPARPTPSQASNKEAAQMKATRQKMNERRQELMDSIGRDAYNGVNLFEGTNPMTPAESKEVKPGSVDLGNTRDPGVDISSLVGGASRMWEAMK